MATVTPTLARLPDSRSRIYTWETITQADEGGSVLIPSGYADKVILLTGTINGGTLTLECSIDDTNWVTAVDAQGNNMAFSALPSALVVGSNGKFWRVANNNSGSAEDLDLSLVCVFG